MKMYEKYSVFTGVNCHRQEGLSQLSMWDIVSGKNFIVHVIHLKIGLCNYDLRNMVDFVESNLGELYKGEEVA